MAPHATGSASSGTRVSRNACRWAGRPAVGEAATTELKAANPPNKGIFRKAALPRLHPHSTLGVGHKINYANSPEVFEQSPNSCRGRPSAPRHSNLRLEVFAARRPGADTCRSRARTVNARFAASRATRRGTADLCRSLFRLAVSRRGRRFYRNSLKGDTTPSLSRVRNCLPLSASSISAS
jgi:hypothetical protein